MNRVNIPKFLLIKDLLIHFSILTTGNRIFTRTLFTTDLFTYLLIRSVPFYEVTTINNLKSTFL